MTDPDPKPTACYHRIIRTWTNEDHPEASVWACDDCGRRFYAHGSVGPAVADALAEARAAVLRELRAEVEGMLSTEWDYIMFVRKATVLGAIDRKLGEGER